MSLEIRLFGTPQVSLSTAPIKFESRKAIALLAILVFENKPIQRAELVNLLWPSVDEKKGKTNLRYTLHILQKEIGKIWLNIDRQCVALKVEPEPTADVWEFRQAIQHEKWGSAVEIASQPFLHRFSFPDAPPFEDWHAQAEETLRAAMIEALERLSLPESGPLPELQLEYGERLVTIDPYNEIGYRALMRSLSATGRRNEALRRYENCVELLHLDLGIDPSAETNRLHNEIIVASKSSHHLRPIAQRGPSTRFFGREQEMAKIEQLISDQTRLITLWGGGGTGKTRLALELMVQLKPHFEDGCRFVPLVTAQSTGNAIAAIATQLDLQFVDGIQPIQQLVRFIKDKQLLLVLDNLEHLITDEMLTFLTLLLERTDRLKLITTSRERLKLTGEHPYPIDGLSQQSKVNGPSFASALFLDRAASFLQIDQHDPAVHDICTLVNGQPLALELAAALTATLSPASILQALKRNIDILQSDLHDIPARHSSLRGIYDASWQSLSAEDQQLVAQFSIFRGGATSEAITSITQASIPSLQNVVNKSFVQKNDERYEMHELMRQYAAEKLQDCEPSGVKSVHKRHARFYVAFFQSQSQSGFNRSIWSADFDNLRQAWDFFLMSPEPLQLKAIIPLIWRYHTSLHRLPELIELFRQGRNQLPQNTDFNATYLELSFLIGQALIYLGHNQEGVQTLLQGVKRIGYVIPNQTSRQILRIVSSFTLTHILPKNQLIQIAEPAAAVDHTLRAAESLLLAGAILYIDDFGPPSTLVEIISFQITQELPAHHPLRLWAASGMFVVYTLMNWKRQAYRLERQIRTALPHAEKHPYVTAAYNSLIAPSFGRKSWNSLLNDVTQALKTSESTEQAQFIGHSYILQGIIQMQSGRFEAGLQTDAELEAHATATSNEMEKTWAIIGKGTFYLRLGQFAKSEAHFLKVLKIIDQGVELGIALGWTYADLALLYAKQNRWEKARDYLKKVEPHLNKPIPFNSQNLSLYINSTHAQLLVLQQSNLRQVDFVKEDEKRLAMMLKILGRFAWLHPVAKPEYDWFRGSYLIYNQKPRRGLWHLKRAYKRAEKMDMPYVAGQIAADLCQLSNNDEKASWFSIAFEKFKRVKAAYDLDKLEKMRQ